MTSIWFTPLSELGQRNPDPFPQIMTVIVVTLIVAVFAIFQL